MITGIAVDNVDILNLIQQAFLLGIGAHDICNARIKAAAENGGNAFLYKPILIGPLPTIFELGDITRLIVCCIHVMRAGFEACIHDRQVLIGQGHIDHQVGFDLVDEGDGLGDIIGIDLSDIDWRLAQFGDVFTGDEAAAGQRDMLERFSVHGAFLRDDRPRRASADDQNSIHFRVGHRISPFKQSSKFSLY